MSERFYFHLLVVRGLIACSSAYAAAERRRRVGAAGARKGPRGVLPGDRWPHEILPSGPWKGPGGVLPGDRWVDLDPCERTPQTPAAPAWPSGLTRGFGSDVRKVPGSNPGPAISARTAVRGLRRAAGSRLRQVPFETCRSRRFCDFATSSSPCESRGISLFCHFVAALVRVEV